MTPRRAAALSWAAACGLALSIPAAQADPVAARGFAAATMSGPHRLVSDTSAPSGQPAQLPTRGELSKRVDLLDTKAVVITLRRGCSHRARLWLRMDRSRPLLITPGSDSWHTFQAPTSIAAGWHTIRLRPARLRRRAPLCATPEIDRVDLLPRDPGAHVLLGAAVRSQDPAANPLAQVTANPQYRTTFLASFDSLTPENELKMLYVEPRREDYTFGDADSLASFALSNNKAIRGHALVIGSQLPDWVTHPAIPWTRNTLLSVMQDYIATVMRHYAGQIHTWDVVNEAFNDDGSYRHNVWYDVIGPDYVEQAFRIAHAADPTATLFYNDIAAERSGLKQSAIYAMAADLRNRGVALNGIGLQNHTDLGGYPDRATIEDSIIRFAQLGLDVEITEMDVGTASAAGTPSERAAAQATAYAAAATACWDVAACRRLTVWGITDAVTWLGTEEAPLPFDVSLHPKPAYLALTHALHRGL